MRAPFSITGTLPVSSLAWAQKTIPLVRARTLSITVRLYFDAAADTNPTVYLFYSPDGNHWDTIAYTSFNITFTASTTVQRTAIIDCPEHGYIWVKVQNGSAASVISNVTMWYTIQSWDSVAANTDEKKYQRELEREKNEETGQLVS
jgi:hypothetical protein